MVCSMCMNESCHTHAMWYVYERDMLSKMSFQKYQRRCDWLYMLRIHIYNMTRKHCSTLWHTATHCNTHVTHSYIWHDSYTLQHTATHCNTHVTHSYIWHDSYTLQHTVTHCNTLQHTCYAFIYMTWLVHTHTMYMPCWYVHVTWRIHIHAMTYDMTRSYTSHDSAMCMTWLLHTDIGWLRLAGALTLQVSLQNIGLFCRALLQKRKETCNFKEPTNRSHPISLCVVWTYSAEFDSWAFNNDVSRMMYDWSILRSLIHEHSIMMHQEWCMTLVFCGVWCRVIRLESYDSLLSAHVSWWVLQHCTGFARLVWGRVRVHRAFVYSDWFVSHTTRVLWLIIECSWHVNALLWGACYVTLSYIWHGMNMLSAHNSFIYMTCLFHIHAVI